MTPRTTTAILATALAAGAALGGSMPAGAATPTPAASAAAATATPSAAPTTTPAPGPAPTKAAVSRLTVRPTAVATTAAPATAPAPTATPTGTPVAPAPSAPAVPTPPVIATPAPTAPVVPTPTPTPTPTRVRIAPLATATKLNHTVGHSSNSRTVLLTGTGFGDLAGVQVGGAPALNLVVLSPTLAKFVLPASLDYQARAAVVQLTSLEDRITRPTPVTFTYKVVNALDKQMAYAFKNWNVRSNAVFGYLSGNDCANFASQSLLARGWVRGPEWYNYGPGRWSGTWVSSTALSNWLKKRPDLATQLPYRARDLVTVGDIIQFRWPGHSKKYTAWDHTGIVSKVVVLPDGRHDIYYTSHTNDRQYGGSTQMFAKYMAKSLRMQFFHLSR